MTGEFSGDEEMGPARVKQVALILIIIIIASCLVVSTAHAQGKLRIADWSFTKTVQYGVDTAWVKADVEYEGIIHGAALGIGVFLTSEGPGEPGEIWWKGLAKGTAKGSPVECGWARALVADNPVTFILPDSALCFFEVWQEYPPYVDGSEEVEFNLELGLGTWDLAIVVSLHIGETIPQPAAYPSRWERVDFAISVLPSITTTRVTTTTEIVTTAETSTSSEIIETSTVTTSTTVAATSPETVVQLLSQPLFLGAILMAVILPLLVFWLWSQLRRAKAKELKEAPAGAKSQQEKKFCPECGAENPATYKYCGKCGVKLTVQ